MSDLNSMIQQVKGSGLSQEQKEELIKRIVRCGPDFDLLAAAGELKGEKRGRDWMIDAASVEERKRKTEGA